MLRKNSSRALIGGITIPIFVVLVWAGTTGKVAGRLTDRATGEPLIGANVILEGTAIGNVTNAEGNFTILNVPPGIYRIRATMLGYRSLVVSQVRVEIDRTARVDIVLEQEALQGEEVTVVADKPLVEADVSSSVTSITNEEVTTLPLTTVPEASSLQAGVEPGLVIRGGGADEALFLVDGFALRDARNNQPITGIALSAIQEFSIERGGFNAEYGQVRSGIVNVVTREGDKRDYSGTVTVKYSDPSRKHFDISPYDLNSMWLRPYLDPAVAFVGTARGSWDEYDQRQFPTFEGWNEIARQRNTNGNSSDDITPAAGQQLFRYQHRRQEITDQPDYNLDAGLGGPVPLIGPKLGNLRFFAAYRGAREMLAIPLTRNDYSDYDFNLKLTSDIKPSMKLNISGVLGKSDNIAINGGEQENSTDYIRTPFEIAQQISNSSFTPSRIYSNSYYSLAKVEHRGLSADFTHVLSPSAFYDFRVDYFERQYDTNPRATRDTTTFELIPGSGIFVDEAPFGWSPSPDAGIGDPTFLFGGHTSTARDQSKSSFIKAKLDFTSQVNFNNQIKTGFEFVYNTLNLDYAILNIPFPEGNIFVNQKWNPLLASAYLQDKIEFKSLIANVGLRLDYSNTKAEWVRAAKYDKDFYSAAYDENATYNMQTAESRLTLSPRIGISHPITTKSKLFFNYGHFKQLPNYEQLFEISRGASNELKTYGDPDLNFAQTISYELGYDHELFGNYLIQLAGFYHDITGQVAYTQQHNRDGSVNVEIASNDSYEDIRGLEVTLRKAYGKWWTGFLSYTYQVNTLGRFGRDQEFENPIEQRNFDNNIGNFAQERPLPQPRANLVLLFHTPHDFGPKVLDGKFFGNWSATFLGTWRAGGFETWNPNRVAFVSANQQRTSFHNLDLRLTKKFDFGPLSATLLADVSNVFNTRRFSYESFFNDFDRINYFESLHLPKSNAYNNIAGDDRPGDFRKPGVAFQPIEQVADVTRLTNPKTRPFYYETTTGRYMHYANSAWQEVPGEKLKEVLDSKAYIDMPNQTSFTFLNPRDIFVGITTAFKF
ncbi:MAG: TonB-dependent receptor [bacterium]